MDVDCSGNRLDLHRGKKGSICSFFGVHGRQVEWVVVSYSTLFQAMRDPWNV